MSRRNRAPIRTILPDPVFNSLTVAKLINTIMLKGKKSLAQAILYGAFEIIKTKTSKDPIEVLSLAIKNVTPHLEVKTRRIGGANYQVPVEVTSRRKDTLAMRWLITYARLRNEHSMEEKLANEIIDASNNIGATIKKKEDTHKMAESNKAFAHYRW